MILAGGGVVIGDAIDECRALAERLDAPDCSGYQHDHSFSGSRPLAMGPLGYMGSKAAIELVAQANVVLARGTCLNPFSTLPGYSIDYWPKSAADTQVATNPDRSSRTPHIRKFDLPSAMPDATHAAVNRLRDASRNAPI